HFLGRVKLLSLLALRSGWLGSPAPRSGEGRGKTKLGPGARARGDINRTLPGRDSDMYLHRMVWGMLGAILGTVILSGTMPVRGANREKYGAVRDFLVAHTKVVELTGENGERVAVCPEYQGRVMTSTAGDLEGQSFGWVNREFISRATPDKHFNNYGGED